MTPEAVYTVFRKLAGPLRERGQEVQYGKADSGCVWNGVV